MRLDDWFLTAQERGNPATRLDSRHRGGLAWSVGNHVRPLIHGAAYFAELHRRVSAMQRGDLLLFTDWRGDPDERLDGSGTEVSDVLCAAAERGVVVAGLVWRSHMDRLAFSEQENRHLGEDIEAAGGQCPLDMRVRPGGSHHMKMVVLRHGGRPERDAAFVGGIDLCHSRRDDQNHLGDPQPQPMAAVYGSRPPWHDLQAMIEGPAVGDVETVFRERWEDQAPLSRNPLHWLRDRTTGLDRRPSPLPPQAPDPLPCGTHAVQLLRTYPYRRLGYDFAPDGERSIARGYLKALPRARSLIYLEDQYLWSAEVVKVLADTLRAQPSLRLIAVIPRFPDQDGKLSMPPNLIGRQQALNLLYAAGPNRVAVYSPENAAGTPIYVHAKVCVVDDTWAMIGSDNFNRRSWTHDSELSCAIVDCPPADAANAESAAGHGPVAGQESFAGQLRLALAREHLGGRLGMGNLSCAAMFDAFARSAQALETWHAAGRHGIRPPGQLRPYPRIRLARWMRAWAYLPYRVIYDPDGRPRAMRRAGEF